MWGAAAGGAVALIQIARDGNLTVKSAKDVAKSVAMGGGVGVAAAKGEQFVTPNEPSAQLARQFARNLCER